MESGIGGAFIFSSVCILGGGLTVTSFECLLVPFNLLKILNLDFPVVDGDDEGDEEDDRGAGGGGGAGGGMEWLCREYCDDPTNIRQLCHLICTYKYIYFNVLIRLQT